MLQSPMHQFHVDHGAQMVEYAGWEMPIKFRGIREEHEQTRTSGSVFDVSHMGRLHLSGLHARRLLERVCTRRIGNMQEGQSRYALVCNEAGGVRDDVIVSRLGADEFMMVCNGANRAKITGHLEAVKAERDLTLKLEDRTLKTAMVAIQGPKVIELISAVSKEIPSLKRFRFTVKNLMIMKLFVSRTGYTGEDGVEVILPSTAVPMAMKLLMKDVDPKDPNAVLKPAGLGARDTLRLEAAMPLYGHELTEDVNALETGLDFAIHLDKNAADDDETFIGQQALMDVRASGGPRRRLVGLELDTKRTARQGMAVLAGAEAVGVVTSGCQSPTLGKSIAMAYVATPNAEPGTGLAVDLGREQPNATVVPLPFYKAPKS